MPKLPSGRHVAFAYDSLKSLIEDALSGLRCDELHSIKTIDDILNYVDVLYFKESSDDIREVEQLLPAGIEPYESGFTITTLSQEIKNWSVADVHAYHHFLVSEQMKSWSQELLDLVDQTKMEIFYLCEDCLKNYCSLKYDPQAKVESNFTPLQCIIWLDEHPDGIPVSATHEDCRRSIMRLSDARKSLWKTGHVNLTLRTCWNSALTVIPDWPGFKRLSVSDDLLEEINSCEEGWSYMVSKFEEFNSSQSKN